MIGYGFFIFFYFLSFEWFTSRFKILYKCLLKIYHLLKIIYFNKKKVKDFTFHMLGFFYKIWREQNASIRKCFKFLIDINSFLWKILYRIYIKLDLLL